eukprot:14793580-Heterocapsa_arctica.AAC.2
MSSDPWDGGRGSPADGYAGLQGRGAVGGRPPKGLGVTFPGGHRDDSPVPGAQYGPGVFGPETSGDGDEPPEGNRHGGVVRFATELPGESGGVGGCGSGGDVNSSPCSAEQLPDRIGNTCVALVESVLAAGEASSGGARDGCVEHGVVVVRELASFDPSVVACSLAPWRLFHAGVTESGPGAGEVAGIGHAALGALVAWGGSPPGCGLPVPAAYAGENVLHALRREGLARNVPVGHNSDHETRV